MRRFEIQEMISQSQQGVTYLAEDKETQRQVALRRFFPYGRDEEGLSAQQQVTYRDTCQHLMRITHTHLRHVVDGGVDPSDKTPYLVTEWIEGSTFSDILNGGTLDPARAMDVVRNALEVSLELSKAYREQAVWVDTEPSSIIVSSEEEGRGYTFWPCSKRWFNTKPKLREVKSIALMAEELTGWNSRVYSKESAGGFGGWVRTMKSVPCMTVESALEQLNALTSGHKNRPSANMKSHPKPVPKPVARPVAKPATKPTAHTAGPATQQAHSALGQPKSATLSGKTTQQILVSPSQHKPANGMIKSLSVIAVCLAISSVVSYLVIQNRIKLQEQLAKNEAIEKANREAKKRQLDATLSRNKPSQQSIPTGKTAIPLTLPKSTNPIGIAQMPASFEGVRIFSPKNKKGLLDHGSGKPVILKAKLHSVVEHQGGIILHLDERTTHRVQGWADPNHFKGELNSQIFKSYIGKEILLEGIFIHDQSFTDFPTTVRFIRANQLRLSDGQTKPADPEPTKPEPARPATNDDIPVFAPEEIAAMAQYGKNKPLRVKGVLGGVTMLNSGRILLYFRNHDSERTARGMTLQKKGNADLNPEFFERFKGKEIIIEGSYVPGKHHNHNIIFTTSNQVRLTGNAPQATGDPEPTDPEASPPAMGGDVPLFSAADYEQVRNLDEGKPLKLKCTIKAAHFRNRDDKTMAFISLEHKRGSKNRISGFFTPNLPSSEVPEDILEPYYGKEVIIHGEKTSFGSNKALAGFSRLDQIEVLENENTPFSEPPPADSEP